MELLKLQEHFPAADIEWRIGRSGKKEDGTFWATCLAYITNRAIMQRLDDVCGPENWKNEYRHLDVQSEDAKGSPVVLVNGGVLCGISIKIGGEWVTKWDGSENTDIESLKGGLSSSMKRAAVQWGIGRYLYNLEEGFATTSATKQKGWQYAKTKDGVFYWQSPALPKWALPTTAPAKAPVAPAATPQPALTTVLEKLADSKDVNSLQTVYDRAMKYDWSPEDKQGIAACYTNLKKKLSPAHTSL
jgi:hypothetical protein